MTIDDLVQNLAQSIPTDLPDEDVVENEDRDNHQLPAFFSFAQERLNQFVQQTSQIDEDELKAKLNENGIFFKPPYTKKRFENLIQLINKLSLEILHLCYQGAIFSAGDLLYKLLGGNTKLGRYLAGPYFNCFKYEIKKEAVYYRMRDDDENVTDCWHVPFHCRRLASTGRYSIAGFPSLYLADSLITASKELGKLQKKHRWYSEFTLKDGKKLFLLDLSTPTKHEIAEMNDFQKIAFILTYPMRLLCSVKTKQSGNPNNEEYFIPQLISHALLMEKKLSEGILYTSTKNKGSRCIVMPAINIGREIVGRGHSEYLKSLWNTTAPQIYETK